MRGEGCGVREKRRKDGRARLTGTALLSSVLSSRSHLDSCRDLEHENGVGPARLVVHRRGCHVTMALTRLDDLGGGVGSEVSATLLLSGSGLNS